MSIAVVLAIVAWISVFTATAVRNNSYFGFLMLQPLLLLLFLPATLVLGEASFSAALVFNIIFTLICLMVIWFSSNKNIEDHKNVEKNIAKKKKEKQIAKKTTRGLQKPVFINTNDSTTLKLNEKG